MIRVVIVDDHVVVRAGLTQLLATTDDIEVVGEADDGSLALSKVAELMPDVVLMDLSMPGLDGVEATRAVKKAYPEVHVVVLTSFGDQARIMAALEAGADGYLLKHADPEQIIAAMRSAIAGGAPLDPKVARVLLTARASGTGSGSASGVSMTDRERQVLLLVSDGLANKQVARRLGISERTVKAHLTNIFQRLGVRDRTQAALWAREHLSEKRI
jgi:DNA-binding NarL/FixJ family response regulator